MPQKSQKNSIKLQKLLQIIHQAIPNHPSNNCKSSIKLSQIIYQYVKSTRQQPSQYNKEIVTNCSLSYKNYQSTTIKPHNHHKFLKQKLPQRIHEGAKIVKYQSSNYWNSSIKQLQNIHLDSTKHPFKYKNCHKSSTKLSQIILLQTRD